MADEPNLGSLMIAVTRVETVMQERRDQVVQIRDEFTQHREDVDKQMGDMRATITKLSTELKDTMSTMGKDVREVRDTMLYTKGAWKVLLGFGALCITIGGLIVKIPWENISKLWSK